MGHKATPIMEMTSSGLRRYTTIQAIYNKEFYKEEEEGKYHHKTNDMDYDVGGYSKINYRMKHVTHGNDMKKKVAAKAELLWAGPALGRYGRIII